MPVVSHYRKLGTGRLIVPDPHEPVRRIHEVVLIVFGVRILLPPRNPFSGIRGNSLSSGGEEFAQLTALQAAHPKQYHGVIHIMLGDVERIGILSQEGRTLFEVRTDNKRARLC